MEIRARALAALACSIGFSTALGAQEAVREGLNLPKLRPGKFDALFTDDHVPNLIWWNPIFKGGAGWRLNPDTADRSAYFGGFWRPLAGRPEYGDLIIGANAVDLGDREAWEVQGEYRSPSGLGFGGGLVERGHSDPDVSFGKLSYRQTRARWSYILNLVVQNTADRTSTGGYSAAYDDNFMLSAGHDGEQWRATLGVIAPQASEPFRPAAEMVYVDNSPGALRGGTFFMVSATLGFSGGFLGHPSRLARAMGPTGLEFGNPLGFLRPTWNRRADLWELGGIGDFRLIRTVAPTGERVSNYETVAFPFQLAGWRGPLRMVFAGGGYTDRNTAEDSRLAILGVVGSIGFLQVAITGHYDLTRDNLRFIVGIIDPF